MSVDLAFAFFVSPLLALTIVPLLVFEVEEAFRS